MDISRLTHALWLRGFRVSAVNLGCRDGSHIVLLEQKGQAREVATWACWEEPGRGPLRPPACHSPPSKLTDDPGSFAPPHLATTASLGSPRVTSAHRCGRGQSRPGAREYTHTHTTSLFTVELWEPSLLPPVLPPASSKGSSWDPFLTLLFPVDL